MDKQKIGMLWAIVMIASVIVMIIVQNVTHWELAWIIPMVGVLICFIITFFFKKEE